MIKQPHDALFKQIFSETVHAAGLFQLILPPALTEKIDYETLELEPGNFVDKVLSARHTDLLFSANLESDPVLLYRLFEHQSSIEQLMPFRLLRYIVRIPERWIAENKTENNTVKNIPAVIPIVLYHGEAEWDAPRALLDPITLPAGLKESIAEHLPSFQFILEDLGERSDKQLLENTIAPKARLALLLLKYARTRDLLARLRQWMDLIEQIYFAKNGSAEFHTLLASRLSKKHPDVLSKRDPL